MNKYKKKLPVNAAYKTRMKTKMQNAIFIMATSMFV